MRCRLPDLSFGEERTERRKPKPAGRSAAVNEARRAVARNEVASLTADARPASHLRLSRQIAIRAATLTAQRQIGFAGF